MKPFDSLYYYSEYYDPDFLMYRFNSFFPQDALDNIRLPSKKGASRYVYQLPSATIQFIDNAYAPARAIDGVDAPDSHIIWADVKSGDITVFANHIHFCRDCINSLMRIPEPNARNMDILDIEKAIFFQVGGVKGGRLSGVYSLLYLLSMQV